MGSSPAAAAAASAAVVALAVANRVLYKLALVPLKAYPFFLAQLTTFGYVAVYFSILYARYRAGVVTWDMLELPKRRLPSGCWRPSESLRACPLEVAFFTRRRMV